ncbi:RusA family crossover junction endodeoxyribonuclease [Corynebacterium sp. P7003]|uniref:RusA family crossover junction endodeoxyribonuclease n=1 Tax=Corynebacterium pygosceleis TaxID=2800406 RepID=A0ABT3WUD7_9CORY|nr:RusA family crossover junction endodeoxyribonuclease [Corynebacterium pygosceleis]MCX7445847.1 RusA family crossover junction endodeoxyribonuclease [Corynebacterium pygosceleis]
MTSAFFAPGIPAPQGSKRHVGNGRMIESSRKVGPWRDAVALAARAAECTPIDGPVYVWIMFYLPRTKAMRRKPAPPMVQKPDLDKLVRSTLDALTGIAFHDDSQVTHITADKRRAAPDEETGALIHISTDRYAYAQR